MKQQALVIIDVQNDYFKNGKMELFQPDLALENVLQLEEKFQQNNLPIIYIQHLQSSSADVFFYENTKGAELHSSLTKHVNSHQFKIIKNYPNSFFQTNLNDVLKQLNIEKVVVTGMMTHMCVDATTRAALELGYETVIISDATATCHLAYAGKEVKAPEVQTAFLAALSMLSDIQTTQNYINSF